MSLSTFPSNPYTSNFVPNFVTVKLSGRNMYDMWKTQMLCFLESHGMLGFINGEIISPEGEGKGNEKVGEMEAWRRSDALVKGWILGSLSEQTFSYVHNRLRLQDISAKDVWDKLESHYNPLALQQTKEMTMEISSSSSNSGEYQYPYPSHVFLPSFVSVKLSGRDMYGVWKTQMSCLLESHDMLGFIDGTIVIPEKSVKGKEKVVGGSIMLWKRSDALVKGWILGSLSEQTLRYIVNLDNTNDGFNAKDVWDKLHIIYGPAPVPQQAAAESEEAKLNEEERKTGEADLTKQVNSESEEAKLNEEENNKKQEIAKEEEKKKKEAEEIAKEEEKKKKEAEEKKKKEAEEKKKKEEDEIAKLHQSLYEATLSKNIEVINRILKLGKVKVTDKITINGNTALHVAVGTTTKKEFLEEMLKLTQKDNNKLDMTNSEGSTVLHVASIVGNTEAVKILMRKNANLFAKDKEGQTPLARAFSNMHTETYLYLLNSSNIHHDIEMGSFFSNKGGEELLVNAISSKDFDSALKLVWEYDILHIDAVLMAMAQNFPSEPNTWERIVYKLITYETDGDYFRTLCDECYQDKRCFLSQTCYVGLVLLDYACIGIFWFFRAIRIILAWPFKFVQIKYERHRLAKYLSYELCDKITSKHPNSVHQYYTKPILEATRQNAHRFVENIVFYFPNAIWSTNEDGHNIIQYAVINRSEKVYNLLYQMSEHKNIYKTIKDSSENNLLHLVATLAPTNKLNLISGAALQIQRELQWFQEVQKFVCPLNIMQKNSFKETPQMIFTREHKELVIEGEKWMKTTAESYSITAALITTIMFAAAITVPGGNNQNTGIPIFTHNAAFSIFAVSDAISLFTSVTSLLLFLSILTARFAEQDFLFKLPRKLVIGLVTLFVSTTAMIIAFGATLFLVFGQSRSWILVPIAVLTGLPITSFVTLQLPLVWEFINATYGRSIFGKKSNRSFY